MLVTVQRTPMKPEDFETTAAGELVRANGPNGEHWAFLPHPLPPQMPLEWQLVVRLSAADRALGELAGVGRHVPNPQMLIQPFIRREAVLSSRIEGTKASVGDVYAFEAGDKSKQGDEDVREVANYVRAMDYGLDVMADRNVTSGLLRELHRILLTGVRGEQDRPGEFRDCPVFIGHNKLEDARFVPPPVVHLRDALEAFDRYLAAAHDYPPLIRLAWLHYQFEAIHPFRDGNGRIGRLLISLLLVHWKLLPLPLLYLSAFFERNRREYYDHLLRVSTHGDWSGWTAYFLSGVIEQATDAAGRAKRLQDLQLQWRALAQGGSHVSAGVLKTIDFLFQRPYLNASTIQELCTVSHPTAMNITKKLAELGFVQEVTGKARDRLFVASEIVAIVN
jgi:Fic family protein